MSNILDTIVASKKTELAEARAHRPLAMLRDMPAYQRPTRSAAENIKRLAAPAVITEFKRRSPSKGWIRENGSVRHIAAGYCAQGAAAVSVLTDGPFFGGSLADLTLAAASVDCPLLRKDFTIDAYQLHEAKAFGADLILLIAAILSPGQVKELADEAATLGVEVLLELHAEEELGHVCEGIQMVGVNNRNLKNFEVNLEHSTRMAASLPAGILRIAESGIHSAEAALYLSQHGFDGFLIGEYFMKAADPSIAFAEFKHAFQTQAARAS